MIIARSNSANTPHIWNIARPEPKDATEQQIGFVAARVVPEPGPVRPAGGEIEFATGARMRIAGTVDAATLEAVIAALAEGRPR
jgi:transposase